MTRSLGAARFLRIAVAALAVTAVAGCSALGGSDAESGDTGNAKVEQAKVTIGIIPQLIDIAGFERAVRTGYFKKEGLEVEVVKIKSAAEAVPQIKAGTLDFAFGNWTSFIQAQAKKAVDIRLVADGLQSKEGM